MIELDIRTAITIYRHERDTPYGDVFLRHGRLRTLRNGILSEMDRLTGGEMLHDEVMRLVWDTTINPEKIYHVITRYEHRR